MFTNAKSLYVADSAGDQLLVEISEHMGFVSIVVGDKFRVDISPDDAFDVVDALVMVANELTSHTGEE